MFATSHYKCTADGQISPCVLYPPQCFKKVFGKGNQIVICSLYQIIIFDAILFDIKDDHIAYMKILKSLLLFATNYFIVLDAILFNIQKKFLSIYTA